MRMPREFIRPSFSYLEDCEQKEAEVHTIRHYHRSHEKRELKKNELLKNNWYNEIIPSTYCALTVCQTFLQAL